MGSTHPFIVIVFHWTCGVNGNNIFIGYGRWANVCGRIATGCGGERRIVTGCGGERIVTGCRGERRIVTGCGGERRLILDGRMSVGRRYSLRRKMVLARMIGG